MTNVKAIAYFIFVLVYINGVIFRDLEGWIQSDEGKYIAHQFELRTNGFSSFLDINRQEW